MSGDVENLALPLLIFISALLYSSVGFAGASGYIAVMGLMGVAPAAMKPAALILNILVAGSAAYKFYRAGAFSWRLFLPLTISSIPCAYIGGFLTLPAHIYEPLIGVILIYTAWRSFQAANIHYERSIKTSTLSLLLICGGSIGLLSGLTGIGGGIFLSPLLISFRWAEARVASGISAAFILINSVSGMLGVVSTNSVALPRTFPFWAFAAVLGGFIGAELGSKRFQNVTIQRVLAFVLFAIGIKMVATL